MLKIIVQDDGTIITEGNTNLSDEDKLNVLSTLGFDIHTDENRQFVAGTRIYEPYATKVRCKNVGTMYATFETDIDPSLFLKPDQVYEVEDETDKYYIIDGYNWSKTRFEVVETSTCINHNIGHNADGSCSESGKKDE